MKRILSIVLFAIISTSSILATTGPAQFDLNGKWQGTRFQYNYEKSKYVAEFKYEFDLKQDGKLVTGTTTITSESGKYAKMTFRGYIDGNKLHFEEKEILEATRYDNMVWCLKKGTLDITLENEKWVLSGKSASFMEVYGLECTGGYTYVTKDVSVKTDEINADARIETNLLESTYKVQTYPNPFVLNTTISFELEKEDVVSVEVSDMQGRSTSILAPTNLKPNKYQLDFTPKDATTNTYYIVNIRIGENVITKHIQKYEGFSGKNPKN